MLEEQWVPLPGYPNYEVSNYGRIANVRTGRDLNPYPDKRTGIMRVAIYNNGLRRDFQVRDIVAECYFLNYKPDVEVRHKNGDKKDCSVLNLTIASGEDLDEIAHKLAKLSPSQVRYILVKVRNIHGKDTV